MITQSQLKKILSYNSDTGVFTWNMSRKKCRIGDAAGSINQLGYVIIKTPHGRYKAHRLAWLYIHGSFPIEQIDHINGKPSDNRISNLRDVNAIQNSGNSKLYCNNTSGRVGVHWSKDRKKWHAHIKVNYKRYHLGSFDDWDDAVEARSRAEKKYGFHENHGRS